MDARGLRHFCRRGGRNRVAGAIAAVGAGLALGALVWMGCGDRGAGDGEPDPVFSTEESIAICVSLKSCFPKEWDAFLWGGSLAACTSAVFHHVPLPANLKSFPMTRIGMEEPMTAFYRCVLAAGGDCASAGRCFSTDGLGGACEGTGRFWRAECEEDVLVGCTADGYRLHIECGAHGASCGVTSAYLYFYQGCSLGSCATDPDERCIGDIARVCSGGRLTSLIEVDCTRLGRTCGADEEGAVSCIGSRACEPDMARRCDGDVAVWCGPGSTEVRHDCRRNRYRRRCEEGSCVPTFLECDDELAEVCEEDEVSFCLDGRAVRASCSSLGFSACVAGSCVD